jgi:hypothetical protein
MRNVTRFWNVSVTLDRRRPEDSMTFVFASRRKGPSLLREYVSLFPDADSVSADPCDAWGRKFWTHTILCRVCGQPDTCGDCNHRRLPDSDCVAMGMVVPCKGRDR